MLPFLMFENDMKHIYAGVKVLWGFVSQTHMNLFQYKQVPLGSSVASSLFFLGVSLFLHTNKAAAILSLKL